MFGIGFTKGLKKQIEELNIKLIRSADTAIERRMDIARLSAENAVLKQKLIKAEVELISKLTASEKAIKLYDKIGMFIFDDTKKDKKPLFTPPFRLGKKQVRAVLDSNGREVVVFPIGLEGYAKEYADFLNSYNKAFCGDSLPIQRSNI